MFGGIFLPSFQRDLAGLFTGRESQITPFIFPIFLDFWVLFVRSMKRWNDVGRTEVHNMSRMRSSAGHVGGWGGDEHHRAVIDIVSESLENLFTLLFCKSGSLVLSQCCAMFSAKGSQKHSGRQSTSCLWVYADDVIISLHLIDTFAKYIIALLRFGADDLGSNIIITNWTAEVAPAVSPLVTHLPVSPAWPGAPSQIYFIFTQRRDFVYLSVRGDLGDNLKHVTLGRRRRTHTSASSQPHLAPPLEASEEAKYETESKKKRKNNERRSNKRNMNVKIAQSWWK